MDERWRERFIINSGDNNTFIDYFLIILQPSFIKIIVG
ncbi:hypothetical protein SD78_4155 [Bacillus badius]|nr:hypothetical protein SD78_4155 [Bacillus badius]